MYHFTEINELTDRHSEHNPQKNQNLGIKNFNKEHYDRTTKNTDTTTKTLT